MKEKFIENGIEYLKHEDYYGNVNKCAVEIYPKFLKLL